MNFTPSLTLLFTFTFIFIFIISILSLYTHFFNSDDKSRARPESTPNQDQELEETATWLVAPPPPVEDASEGGGGGEERRRRKKGRKKRNEGGGCPLPCPEKERAAADGIPFPFSPSSTSATQRKMKAQYDELVKSNQAKRLTMAQVGQFVNCLVDAKNELQQKSEIIRRSFKIKKALLVKADRSSFDRHCQQIYKLEAEQKRLEEDVAVYNLLQEQLKLSPAYKTMLEVGASMEVQVNQDQAAVDFCDISFEELLAQEKKDSFWQRNGKLRSFAS